VRELAKLSPCVARFSDKYSTLHSESEFNYLSHRSYSIESACTNYYFTQFRIEYLVMAIQTRSSTSLPHRRLTRSSPSHLKAVEIVTTQTRASAVARRLKNNELASLHLSDPKLPRRSDRVTTNPRKVTKRKGKRGTAQYQGPGYSAEAKRSNISSHKECVICADSKEL